MLFLSIAEGDLGLDAEPIVATADPAVLRGAVRLLAERLGLRICPTCDDRAAAATRHTAAARSGTDDAA